MREILISSAVCVVCLMVAFVSQLVSPTVVAAASPSAREATLSRPAAGSATPTEARPAVAAPLELDPDDPNPVLFAMAPDPTTSPSGGTSDASLAQSGAAALGGGIVAPKERMTESGLRITDLVEGEGAEAVPGRNVVVHYRGTLENGKEFDSSYGRGPFTFPLGGGRVIQGWDEGVAGMKVGGKRRLVIPPDLAYGSRGAGGIIPPDATLIFEVELLEVGS
jgi:peptidylprolyl isomerase